jgi:hypothetical protein
MFYVRNVTLFCLYLVGFLNRIIPKFNIIIFFTNNSESNDNNLALLHQLIKFKIHDQYKIYFFSKDGNKYSYFKEVRYKSVFFAPVYFLFAKYCFYDCGTLKIKPSKKQYVISLWHGVPLKKIGSMLGRQSSKFDKYNDFSKILVPSVFWIDIYKKSFECTEDQIYINGFPRNDFLFYPAYEKLYKLNINDKFKKSVLWMPTFRISIGGYYQDTLNIERWDLPIFNNINELKEFNNALVKLDTQLVIKLHPYSTFNLNIPNNFSNIIFVRNLDLNQCNIINYEFVACFDALITDYSSILFDYLLVNKPIAFTVDDLENYNKKRGFNFLNPEKFLVGDKILTICDLLNFVKNINLNIDNYAYEKELLKNEIHRFNDNKSTDRLLKEIKLI